MEVSGASSRRYLHDWPVAILSTMRYGVATIVLLAVAAAACGGGGQMFNLTVAPGRASCDALLQVDSYRYKEEIDLTMADRDPAATPGGDDRYGPTGFSLNQAISGDVEKGGKMHAVTASSGKGFADSQTEAIVIGDKAWANTDHGWSTVGLQPPPIAYLPIDMCQAVSPDINVSGMTGASDSPDGIESLKYHFDSFASTLTSRHPSFGAGSAMGALIKTYTGDIWIADDGHYVNKLDLTGTGKFNTGRLLTLKISLEISNLNDGSINILPPPVGSPAR